MVHTIAAIDIALCTEGQGVNLALGALVHGRSHFTRKRHAIDIGLDEVLLDSWSQFFHQVTSVANDGEDTQQRVFGLQHVVDTQGDQRPHDKKDPPDIGKTKRQPDDDDRGNQGEREVEAADHARDVQSMRRYCQVMGQMTV